MTSSKFSNFSPGHEFLLHALDHLRDNYQDTSQVLSCKGGPFFPHLVGESWTFLSLLISIHILPQVLLLVPFKRPESLFLLPVCRGQSEPQQCSLAQSARAGWNYVSLPWVFRNQKRHQEMKHSSKWTCYSVTAASERTDQEFSLSLLCRSMKQIHYMLLTGFA